MVMNSPFGYIHVNLEEMTLINFFQDYCDINEIEIWPSLMGEIKKGESDFSFSLPRVHGLGWDLTLHNSFPQKLQQRQQKSQSIWLWCNTNQIPTHTLERIALKEAFSYGKLRQFVRWACLRAAVWIQYVFFTTVFTMLRFPIALVTWTFSVTHPQNARHPLRQLIG